LEGGFSPPNPPATSGVRRGGDQRQQHEVSSSLRRTLADVVDRSVAITSGAAAARLVAFGLCSSCTGRAREEAAGLSCRSCIVDGYGQMVLPRRWAKQQQILRACSGGVAAGQYLQLLANALARSADDQSHRVLSARAMSLPQSAVGRLPVTVDPRLLAEGRGNWRGPSPRLSL